MLENFAVDAKNIPGLVRVLSRYLVGWLRAALCAAPGSRLKLPRLAVAKRWITARFDGPWRYASRVAKKASTETICGRATCSARLYSVAVMAERRRVRMERSSLAIDAVTALSPRGYGFW